MSKEITWTQSDCGNARYISDVDLFNDCLPNGVINKKLPDVGATYFASNCKQNYIIVCPTVDLVDSIASDENNKYPIFKCHSGVFENHYKSFINDYSPEYIKIAVTYDRFEKLTEWVNPKEFKVLIDEYHLLLYSFDFRQSAIDSLFATLKKYDHVSFVSATPINPKFEIKELNKLPHYEINWNNTDKIDTYRIKTTAVIPVLCKIIDSFNDKGIDVTDITGNLSKVDELFIFLNSVSAIKQVCDTLKLNPDDVKICCSNRNKNMMILGDYEISNVTSPNKRINFFTSKCFQGCNLFTNSGLIIVCSDGGKKSMMTDLSSDLIQIAGRLRFNKKYQNKFRNTLIHIYNTCNEVQTDEEFELTMNELKHDGEILMSGIQKMNLDERKIFIKRINLTNDVVIISDDNIVYSENKEMYFRYYHELKKMYKNGITVRGSYDNDKFTVSKRQLRMHTDFIDKLSVLSVISYQQLVNDLYENKNINLYKSEYPEFEDYLKYLTPKEVNSMRYNKDKMIACVESKKRLESVIDSVLHEGYMTSKEIKELLKEKFSEMGITISPKASLIEKSKKYLVYMSPAKIDGVMVRGYKIQKNPNYNFLKNNQ